MLIIDIGHTFGVIYTKYEKGQSSKPYHEYRYVNIIERRDLAYIRTKDLSGRF
jgi:hypothetical protein